MIDLPAAPSSILVDIELPDADPLPPELVRVLSSLRVVLLGWFSVPEQIGPEQARNRFRDEAQDALDAEARRFREAGADVATHLMFTENKLDSIRRVSQEESCDAVLIPGPVEQLRRILVPLRGLHNVHEIAPFVADLCQDGTAEVTLLHVVEDEETEASAHADVLEPTAELIYDHGIKAGVLELASVSAGDRAGAIREWSDDYDLVVLGETEPSVYEVLFGTVPERIVTTTDTPVIVVRHRGAEVKAAEQAIQAGLS